MVLEKQLFLHINLERVVELFPNSEFNVGVGVLTNVPQVRSDCVMFRKERRKNNKSKLELLLRLYRFHYACLMLLFMTAQLEEDWHV